MTSPNLQFRFLPYIQFTLFIIINFLFQLQFFNLTFVLLLLILLTVGFLPEENRLFTWITIAFFIGQFCFLYGDRLILNFQLTREWEIICSRLLLLFPILFISFVTFMFKRKILGYPLNADWNETISLPFQWHGRFRITMRRFFIFTILLFTAGFFPFIFEYSASISLYTASMIVLLTLTNSILESLLWQGILLTRFSSLSSEKIAGFFLSVAYGLSHLTIGYSLGACLLFTIQGLFLAYLTVKSFSILPTILVHFVFNVFMILSETIPFWVS